MTPPNICNAKMITASRRVGQILNGLLAMSVILDGMSKMKSVLTSFPVALRLGVEELNFPCAAASHFDCDVCHFKRRRIPHH
jgi:hypothetical protein